MKNIVFIRLLTHRDVFKYTTIVLNNAQENTVLLCILFHLEEKGDSHEEEAGANGRHPRGKDGLRRREWREEQRKLFLKEKEEENIRFREMQEEKCWELNKFRNKMLGKRSAVQRLDRQKNQTNGAEEVNAALAAQRKQELWKKHEESLNTKIEKG